MSRYFFHIRDGLVFIPDEEGVECRNQLAAWEEALSSASDLAVSRLKSRAAGPAATIEMEDEDGNRIEDPAVNRRLN